MTTTRHIFRGVVDYVPLRTFPKTMRELEAMTPRLCVQVAETVQDPAGERLLPTTLLLVRGVAMKKADFVAVDDEDKDAAGYIVRVHSEPLARTLLIAFWAQATLVIHSTDAVRMVLAVRGKGVKTVRVVDGGAHYAIENDPDGLDEIFGGLPEIPQNDGLKN